MSLSMDITRFETEGFQALCDFVNYENFPSIPTEAMERLHRILIQAQGGQMSRPRVMFKIARSMIEHDLTEEEMQDIYALGWVMELLQFAI
ncbi:hypothetical protein N7465_008502 [Penicillium sp. CMV-2018d]|nr:hypothetical protein N7465_008502 [Penicillium sp. CMV-2018d]